jgi:hypothetical protein
MIISVASPIFHSPPMEISRFSSAAPRLYQSPYTFYPFVSSLSLPLPPSRTLTHSLSLSRSFPPRLTYLSARTEVAVKSLLLKPERVREGRRLERLCGWLAVGRNALGGRREGRRGGDESEEEARKFDKSNRWYFNENFQGPYNLKLSGIPVHFCRLRIYLEEFPDSRMTRRHRLGNALWEPPPSFERLHFLLMSTRGT